MQKTINILSEAYKITKNPYHDLFTVFFILFIFLAAYTHFQNFTQIQELHTKCKMPRICCIHYHKHISKANICKHTFAIPARFVCVT